MQENIKDGSLRFYLYVTMVLVKICLDPNKKCLLIINRKKRKFYGELEIRH